MIPRIDAAALIDPANADHAAARAAVAEAATGVGFMTVFNTGLSAQMVETVIESYRAFFHMPAAEKATYNMALTGSNRGWGAPGSEQVDPDANPDYKQVFDCGLELADDDPVRKLGLACYAPNIWPDYPTDFATNLQIYYVAATQSGPSGQATRISGSRRTRTTAASHCLRQTGHLDWKCASAVAAGYHCRHHLESLSSTLVRCWNFGQAAASKPRRTALLARTRNGFLCRYSLTPTMTPLCRPRVKSQLLRKTTCNDVTTKLTYTCRTSTSRGWRYKAPRGY